MGEERPEPSHHIFPQGRVKKATPPIVAKTRSCFTSNVLFKRDLFANGFHFSRSCSKPPPDNRKHLSMTSPQPEFDVRQVSETLTRIANALERLTPPSPRA